MARNRRKKLRRVTRDLCAQDFINRAARFLFAQGPAKRKPLNGTTQRAWQETGHGESGWRPGIVVAKKQSRGFLLWPELRQGRADLH
ncbi:hypothetical protein [Shinella sp.]|uniref:hypothetical protein n=1 Tax=Shinella sp. TaxID=1870904 RepID=UPI00289B57FE|nr:hypothetical protein [Shinella sp.]